MGSDIHGFIETRRKNTPGWIPFAQMYLAADYEAFACLAGVRGRPGSAIIAPRGLPADVSLQAKNACTLFIVYSHDQEIGDGCVSFDDAGKWVSKGKSQFFGVMKPVTVTFTPHGGVPETKTYFEDLDGQPSHITNPDFHSFTWLTADEFENALRRIGHVPLDYEAVNCAMKKLKEADYEVRVVLWFDN